METTWALDLDGVVWLARRGIPGSADAVTALRNVGKRVIFLTNNSGPRLADHIYALNQVGIECGPDDVATSAQAAASLVAKGSRAAMIGDDGVREALAARDVEVVAASQGPETVVVGRTVDLDYDELSAAASAVREGARFIATNTDATFPVGDSKLLPGAGALVAFVATAAGKRPEVAGKPHEAMAALVRARYGQLEMMVGDRPDTDGLFGQAVGAQFGLVLSGVTGRGDLPVEPRPELIGDDLAALVASYLRTGAG
jgi:glycerol-1-phosphatase